MCVRLAFTEGMKTVGVVTEKISTHLKRNRFQTFLAASPLHPFLQDDRSLRSPRSSGKDINICGKVQEITFMISGCSRIYLNVSTASEIFISIGGTLTLYINKYFMLVQSCLYVPISAL